MTSIKPLSFEFALELNQDDFDDICETWNLSEPLNNQDLKNIFQPLLKKLYYKLIAQWEMNHTSNTDKKLLIKFWKQNFEDTYQSQYHYTYWLQILKENFSNEKYTNKQCLNSFNDTVVLSVMDNLNHVLKILNKSWSNSAQDNLAIATKSNQLNLISPIALCTMPLPPSLTRLASDPADGVTRFNKILQITDWDVLQKELSKQRNWDLLLDEIYANLTDSNYKSVIKALKQICQNLFEEDRKYRRIFSDNEKIQKRILMHRGGYEFLFGVGFKKVSKRRLVCENPNFDVVAAALSALNKKCDDNMKFDLLDLIKKINAFHELYDQNKVKYLHQKSRQLLPTNKEIENSIVSLNKFVCKLSNMKTYICLLDQPDISRYSEWNMDVVIKWIGSLEHGRFVKYVDTLRKGFVSDGISAALLPQLTSIDLRHKPFQITDFSDRNSLIKHFGNLKDKKRESKNEGFETEYI